MKKELKIPYEVGLSLFEYDEESCMYLYKSGHKEGLEIGCDGRFPTKSAYKKIRINGSTMLVHRLVWSMHNKSDIPEGMAIDHIDGNTRNNSPLNLRLLSKVENARSSLQVWRKSLPPGVYSVGREKDKKYRCRIMVDGKLYLGEPRDTSDLAFADYIAMKKNHHNFIRTNYSVGSMISENDRLRSEQS